MSDQYLERVDPRHKTPFEQAVPSLQNKCQSRQSSRHDVTYTDYDSRRHVLQIPLVLYLPIYWFSQLKYHNDTSLSIN